MDINYGSVFEELENASSDCIFKLRFEKKIDKKLFQVFYEKLGLIKELIKSDVLIDRQLTELLHFHHDYLLVEMRYVEDKFSIKEEYRTMNHILDSLYTASGENAKLTIDEQKDTLIGLLKEEINKLVNMDSTEIFVILESLNLLLKKVNDTFITERYLPKTLVRYIFIIEMSLMNNIGYIDLLSNISSKDYYAEENFFGEFYDLWSQVVRNIDDFFKSPK